METGEAKPLYYKRVIWLKPDKAKEADELILALLEKSIYIYKGIEVVLDIKEMLELTHVSTVYNYFEELKRTEVEALNTLCVLHYNSPSLISRDTLVSKLTRIWTTYATAYIGVPSIEGLTYKEQKSFDYIVDSINLDKKLASIVSNGYCNKTNNL